MIRALPQTLAGLALLLGPAPVTAGGLVDGRVPAEDPVRIARDAERVALDAALEAGRTLVTLGPLSQPVWAPQPPLLLQPAVPEVAPVAISTGDIRWLAVLPALALVPLLLDGGNDAPPRPSLPQELPEGPGQPGQPGQPAPAIPEPATWALLLLGFGAIGAALRRRRAAAGCPAR